MTDLSTTTIDSPAAYLLVDDIATGASRLMSLEQAEALTQIDRHEIEWALEEYGLCESIDHVIRDSRPSVEIAASVGAVAEG